jgi:hypothetical protein
MDACDGIELLGVLAAARERHTDAARLLAAAGAARRPLRYLAPRIHRQPRRGRTRRQPGPARPRRRPLHPGVGRRPSAHPRRRGSLRRPQRRRPQTTGHRLGQPDPRRTGGRPPCQRRPAKRRHRPAAVHCPRHRQGAPVPHLRQAQHHHPHRTGCTGSRTGSDRQMIWRVDIHSLSRRHTRSQPKMIRRGLVQVSELSPHYRLGRLCPGLRRPARGTARICQMSLNDGVWKLWRQAPGFWQRYTGGVPRRRQDGRGRLGGSGEGPRRKHGFDLNHVRPGGNWPGASAGTGGDRAAAKGWLWTR